MKTRMYLVRYVICKGEPIRKFISQKKGTPTKETHNLTSAILLSSKMCI